VEKLPHSIGKELLQFDVTDVIVNKRKSVVARGDQINLKRFCGKEIRTINEIE
jgi:hypothetical protein